MQVEGDCREGYIAIVCRTWLQIRCGLPPGERAPGRRHVHTTPETQIKSSRILLPTYGTFARDLVYYIKCCAWWSVDGRGTVPPWGQCSRVSLVVGSERGRRVFEARRRTCVGALRCVAVCVGKEWRSLRNGHGLAAPDGSAAAAILGCTARGAWGGVGY